MRRRRGGGDGRDLDRLRPVTRALRGLFVAGAGLALLTACASGPVAGIVTEKTHSPEESGVVSTITCHPAGKATICTPIVIPWHHDECWGLHLRNDRGDEGDVCVDRGTWDKTEVGDFVDTSPKEGR